MIRGGGGGNRAGYIKPITYNQEIYSSQISQYVKKIAIIFINKSNLMGGNQKVKTFFLKNYQILKVSASVIFVRNLGERKS